jgi:hypothetical protein
MRRLYRRLHAARTRDARTRAIVWAMTDAVNIAQLLRDSGFDTPEAARRAREMLEQAAMTHTGKAGLSAAKVEAARALLTSRLLRACCDDCTRIDRAGIGAAREAVRVTPPSCEICGGSNNRRAAIWCVAMLYRRGIRRVVIVGGTGAQRRELEELLGASSRDTGIEIRFVDGTRQSHTGRDALANMRWAQLVVIWASTPLKHSISHLYVAEPPPHLRVLTVTRRSVEALCSEIVRSYT